MRKLIVKIKLNNKIKEIFDYLLDKIESLELLELLRIDFEEGVKLVLVSYTLKEGYTIDDIDFPSYIENINLIKKEGNKYICLTKATFLQKITQMYQLDYNSLSEKFKMDVIWDTPTVFTKEEMTVSLIGDEENLKKFLKAMKFVGEIRKVSYKKPIFNDYTVLNCLTDKQREILIKAKNNGYYNYPRKINSEKLSEIIGLSKPTVVQHLRKAEIRLITNLLAGY